MQEFNIDVMAQGVGLLASALAILGFAHKSDKHFKLILVGASLTFTCHFFLLGAYVAAAISLINGVRTGLSLKFHRSNTMMISFFLIYILAGFLTYHNPQDILAILAGSISTFAMYKLSGIQMRVCIMFASGSWLIHDVIYRSIGGVITELFVLTTNAITIYRLVLDQKKDAHDESPSH